MNDAILMRQNFRKKVDGWKKGGILLEKTGGYQLKNALGEALRAESRKGFGNRYYYMMRLLDAFLGAENLALTDCAPHKAASALLEDWFCFLPATPRRVVSARHRLKYDRIEPLPEVARLLEQIIGLLENLLQSDFPADSLQALELGLQQKINNHSSP
jgi:hypothetical protein